MRMMRTFQSQSPAAQRGASGRLTGSGGGGRSPLTTTSITLTALLIFTLPGCKSAPAELQKVTAEYQGRLLSQIDVVCSSYLSANLQFWASDVFGELCVLMLVKKSKELKVRENSKRADLQGPGGIQSRGYFLYRPRNGRRSLEYE